MKEKVERHLPHEECEHCCRVVVSIFGKAAEDGRQGIYTADPCGQVRSAAAEGITLKTTILEGLDIGDEHERQPEVLDSAEASCFS